MSLNTSFFFKRRNAEEKSSTLSCTLGKMQDVGIPEKSGGFTRTDAYRNVLLARRLKERTDAHTMILAQRTKEHRIKMNTPVTKVSIVKLVAKATDGNTYHATGIGNIKGDLKTVREVLLSEKYTHMKIGAIKQPLAAKV